MTDLLALADERFVSLVTFRRSGAEVPTPVWVARVDDTLVVTTSPASGKVRLVQLLVLGERLLRRGSGERAILRIVP